MTRPRRTLYTLHLAGPSSTASVVACPRHTVALVGQAGRGVAVRTGAPAGARCAECPPPGRWRRALASLAGAARAAYRRPALTVWNKARW